MYVCVCVFNLICSCVLLCSPSRCIPSWFTFYSLFITSLKILVMHSKPLISWFDFAAETCPFYDLTFYIFAWFLKCMLEFFCFFLCIRFWILLISSTSIFHKFLFLFLFSYFSRFTLYLFQLLNVDLPYIFCVCVFFFQSRLSRLLSCLLVFFSTRLSSTMLL